MEQSRTAWPGDRRLDVGLAVGQVDAGGLCAGALGDQAREVTASNGRTSNTGYTKHQEES